MARTKQSATRVAYVGCVAFAAFSPYVSMAVFLYWDNSITVAFAVGVLVALTGGVLHGYRSKELSSGGLLLETYGLALLGSLLGHVAAAVLIAWTLRSEPALIVESLPAALTWQWLLAWAVLAGGVSVCIGRPARYLVDRIRFSREDLTPKSPA